MVNKNEILCGNCGFPMGENLPKCPECQYPVSSDEQVFWNLNRAIDYITWARDEQEIVMCTDGACICSEFDNIADAIEDLIGTLQSKLEENRKAENERKETK